MKNLILLIIFFYSNHVFSQGTLNDFPYDKDDLNIILNEMGFHTFKYPIKQSVNQLCDFVIEQYQDGILLNTKSIIQSTRKKFEEYGIDWKKYFNPLKDSIYFHRFYFKKQDSTLSLRIKSQGSSSVETINKLGSSLYDLRTLDKIKSEIDENDFLTVDSEKDLIFLYSNMNNVRSEPLYCPSGLPKNEVIKRFKYVLYIKLKLYKN